MDDEGQDAAEEDDGAEDAELLPLADDDGLEDLAAHLELEGEGDALAELDADVVALLGPEIEAFECREDQNEDADHFEQDRAGLYGISENLFQQFDTVFHNDTPWNR